MFDITKETGQVDFSSPQISYNFDERSWLQKILVCNANSCTISVNYSPTASTHNIPEDAQILFSYFDGVTTQNIPFNLFGQVITTPSIEVSLGSVASNSNSNNVDILWVQDRSSSMGDEIEGIRENFQNFLRRMEIMGGNYRIAFITMRWKFLETKRYHNERLSFTRYSIPFPRTPYSLLRSRGDNHPAPDHSFFVNFSGHVYSESEAERLFRLLYPTYFSAPGTVSWCFADESHHNCNNYDEIFTLTENNDFETFSNSFGISRPDPPPDPLPDRPIRHPHDGYQFTEVIPWRISHGGLEAVEYFLEYHDSWFREGVDRHAIIVSDDDNFYRSSHLVFYPQSVARERFSDNPQPLSEEERSNSQTVRNNFPQGSEEDINSLNHSLLGHITIHSIVGTGTSRSVDARFCPGGVRRDSSIDRVGTDYMDFSNRTRGSISDIRCNFGDNLNLLAERVTSRSFPLSLKAIDGSPCTTQIGEDEISCSFSEDRCTIFFGVRDLEGVMGETITVEYDSSWEQCE